MHRLPLPLARGRAALPALAALAAIPAAAAAQGDLLFTACVSDGFLRTVDPVTAATLSSLQMTTSNSLPVTACNGMSRDPVSGALWVVVREGTALRNLARLDPATGLASIVAPLPDNFAGISFRADGTLFGVTGDGAVVPETLWTIDLATAVATQVIPLGNGNDGEAILFAPDGFLYHASGFGTPNVDEILERIDTSTNAITPVPLSGADYDEVIGWTAYAGGNTLIADWNDDLLVLDTAGRATRIGALDHSGVKGMAFVPSPPTQAFFRSYGEGCAAAAGPIPLLAGRGTPAPGQTVTLDLLLAPPGSFGLLAFGLGNGTLPVPSPACRVQVAPVGALSGFVTGPLGTFSLPLPLPLPLGLPPGDFFFQPGVIDGGGFVVGNPVQMHFR